MKRRYFTLVEIMIVVAIIGLLAAIAIPSFINARNTSRKNACINNLRQIDGAIQQYALENRIASGGPVTMANCTPYLKGGATPLCPASGNYAVTTVTAPPTCSTGAPHILP
jgi:prepilin-type N-terminal cleavage/methylation domain-containing protein